MRQKIIQEFLASFIDAIKVPLLIIDRDHRISRMNQAAKTCFRTGVDVGSQPYCYSLMNRGSEPCSQPERVCPVREVFKTGKTVSTLHRHRYSSGDKLLMEEVTVTPLFADNGEVVQVIKIINDMSESIRTSQVKEKHKALNLLFRNVEYAKREWEMSMDCIKDMVILSDVLGRIQRCNKAVVDFTGEAYSKILGQKWTSLLLDHGLESKDFFGESCEYYHEASGRWFFLVLDPIKNNDGELKGFVITLRDLTYVKRVSAQLEQANREIDRNRRKLQSALDEVSSLIQTVVVKEEFNVRFTNPELKNCWEVMQCKRRNCTCYGKEKVRCWQEAGTFCKKQRQGAFAQKYENCLDCPNYKMATEDPVYLIGEQFNNMMHIIETKNNELEITYSDLKLTQSRMLQHEKMASVGILAAGVAHEINNPIGFISSNLNTLNKYVKRLIAATEEQEAIILSLNDPQAEIRYRELQKELKLGFIQEDALDLVDESLDGCSRVSRIVNNLKGFSRVDEAQYQAADLAECIDTTINIIWNELKYKATLEKEYDGELPPVFCYPQQLNQVFMNLLINAAQSMEDSGRIHIKTEKKGSFAQITFADTGKGISDEHLPYIFDPFFTTKEVGKGTGLGLSIVHDIITKNHKGEILVDSEVGKGTTFTVNLPFRQDRTDD